MNKTFFTLFIAILTFSCTNNIPNSGLNKDNSSRLYIDDTYTFKGNINAKNTIFEFIDFKCHFCANSQPIINKVINTYPNDVKVVIKHYPFISNVSFELAYLFEKVALYDKKKAIELYDYIFNNQSTIQTLEDVKNLEKKYLDKDISTAQMDKIKEKVNKDIKEASDFQISGTPLFIINGKTVIKGFREEKDFFDILQKSLIN